MINIPLLECMVCLEEKDKFTAFPCKHEVCHECYEKIMEINPECPLCQTTLQVNKCNELFYVGCCTITVITLGLVFLFK